MVVTPENRTNFTSSIKDIEELKKSFKSVEMELIPLEKVTYENLQGKEKTTDYFCTIIFQKKQFSSTILIVENKETQIKIKHGENPQSLIDKMIEKLSDPFTFIKSHIETTSKESLIHNLIIVLVLILIVSVFLIGTYTIVMKIIEMIH